jgi:hypothetical protein
MKNGKQDCIIGTVQGFLWEGVVNGGDEGEGIWLMGFIPLAIALSGVGRGVVVGEMVGTI